MDDDKSFNKAHALIQSTAPWVLTETVAHFTVKTKNNETVFHDLKKIQLVKEEAHLIAAAPDLLEALVDMLMCDNNIESLEKAKKAIEKATKGV